VSDLFRFDLADGFASGRCPICHAVALDERRWVESFRREGRRDPEARTRFWAGGGFCARHASLLSELVAESGSGAAVADVYGALADRDLAELDAVVSGRSRKTRHATLSRTADCSACVAAADALERKVHFFLELLGTFAGRARYEPSAGLCRTHLESVVGYAGRDEETALYLIGEWRQRLAAVRQRLHEDERGSWPDIIRLYVGRPS
jgi:hypothetical protein